MIKADLAAVCSDAHAGSASITYCHRNLSAGGATYNPATGVITDPQTKVTGISCIVGTPTAKDAANAKLELESVDRKFLIDRSDLTYDPTAGDQILYGSATFEVVHTRYHAATGVVVILAAVLGGEA